MNPDLVIRDPDGKPYTVRYEAVNAMLLNEFLKEHRTVQEQQATIALQESQIKALTAGLREQATQIQKVSAQLEMIKPAPQVVENRYNGLPGALLKCLRHTVLTRDQAVVPCG